MAEMTRKEAIGHIKDVICENNTIKPNIVVFEQEKEALYMAISDIGRVEELEAENKDLREKADMFLDWADEAKESAILLQGKLDRIEAENKRLTDLLYEQSKNLDSLNLEVESLEAEIAKAKTGH